MPHSYIGVASFTDSVSIATAVASARIRTVLEAVAETIDGPVGCNRTFQPYSATRYYRAANGSCLLLDEDLIAVTSLGSDDDGDGTYENTWAASDYYLEPDNNAARQKPYWQIDAADAGAYSFPTGARRGVQIVGIWGNWRDLLVLSATLNEALDTTETGVDLTATSELEVGQTILIDSEQMYVTAISSPTLTVERGANGTTAAAHSSTAAVSLYRYPPGVVEASRQLAERYFMDKNAPHGIATGADMEGAGGAGPVIIPSHFTQAVREYLSPHLSGRGLVA